MQALRILMLEDNPIDVSVIRKALTQCSHQLEITLVSNGADYVQQLSNHDFDVILCDYQLPAFDAVQALTVRNQKNSGIPFILVTGAVPEEVAVTMVKEGASDYILKDRLQRLPLAVEKAVRKQQLSFDKQHLETSLSQLTERFQLAARTSFDVIWDYDLQKQEVYCSHAMEKITGVPLPSQLQPSQLKSFIYPDDLPAIEKSLKQIIAGTDHRWRKLFRMLRKDGTVAWVNTNAMVLRDGEDRAVRVVGVLHDITEVRRLQHELVEQEMQTQKQIAAITIEAQEKERTEIGRELHDNVNQLLATAKIMIDTARAVPGMHDLCLAKSQESILLAIRELRNISHSMMPPKLDETGFENILQHFAEDVRLSGIAVHLSLPAPEALAALSADVKLAFYRIIQEQVSNILKYAKAENISIAIIADRRHYSLAIQDDGVGFRPEQRSKGIGLRNIESRCQLLGGRMNLITAPGEGCLLRVRVPVAATRGSSFRTQRKTA